MNNKEKERKGIPFCVIFWPDLEEEDLDGSSRRRRRDRFDVVPMGDSFFFEGCFGGFGSICLLLLLIDLRWNGFVTVGSACVVRECCWWNENGLWLSVVLLFGILCKLQVVIIVCDWLCVCDWVAAVMNKFLMLLMGFGKGCCCGVVMNSRSTVMLQFGLCRTWLRPECVSAPVRLEFVVVELLCVWFTDQNTYAYGLMLGLV